MSHLYARALMLLCDCVAFCLLLAAIYCYHNMKLLSPKPRIEFIAISLSLISFGLSAWMTLASSLNGKWKAFNVCCHLLLLIGPALLAGIAVHENETSPKGPESITTTVLAGMLVLPLHLIVVGTLAFAVAYHNERHQ